MTISVEALLAAARLEALPLEQDPTARVLGLVPDGDEPDSPKDDR